MAFIVRAYDVIVQGFPPVQFLASSPARARARAWQSYCSYDAVSFRDFLRLSTIQRGVSPAGFGKRILIADQVAYRVGPTGHYVPFVRDDSDTVLFSHPLDVVEIETGAPARLDERTVSGPLGQSDWGSA